MNPPASVGLTYNLAVVDWTLYVTGPLSPIANRASPSSRSGPDRGAEFDVDGD